MEELVHAVQDYGFYGATAMINAKRNVEFEAKVFHDIAEAFHDADCPYGCSATGYALIGTAGQSTNFMNQYQDFINHIIQNRVFSASDIATFQNLCNQWNSTDVYQSNFTPQVLRHFFGKPRPPKP